MTNSRSHRKTPGSGSAIGDDTINIEPRPPSLSDAELGDEKSPDGGVSPVGSGCKTPSTANGPPRRPFKEIINDNASQLVHVFVKFARFVGPGFLIAVAYIDPGNYATDVAAGAQYKYALLFIVLLSNLFAILLQSLCIKLGSVTGLNLAENCREHLPRWIVYILYFFAEAAIIATDIAEVRHNPYSYCLKPYLNIAK